MLVNKHSFFPITIFSYLLLLYLFPEGTRNISLAFIGLCSIYVLGIYKTVYLDHQIIAWVTYILLCFLSSFINVSFISNIFEFIAALIIGIMVYHVNKCKQDHFSEINVLKCISIIAFLGCIMQLFFPDILVIFNKIHLGTEKYEIFSTFYSDKTLVGFSFQTAITGFYLSILFGFIYCRIISNPKNKKNNIYLFFEGVITFVFILLTGKRGFILIVVFTSILIYCIINKKHAIKALVVCTVLIASFICMILYTDAGKRILKRSTGESWSSGRTTIYNELISRFLHSPILGVGAATSSNLLGYSNGHNIYLQILSETGIVGFLIIIPIFIHDNYIAIKLINLKIQRNDDLFIVLICFFVEMLFIGWGFTGNPLYDLYPLVVYMMASGIIRSEFEKIQYEEINTGL